jgi:hypothetical protein
MEGGRIVVKGIVTKNSKVDPWANTLIHGIGHVLFQKKNEQYKVIDLDNAGRRASGVQERPYDDYHCSDDGIHNSGKFGPEEEN